MSERETNGNRTHEPSLRELTAELDGVKDLLEEKIRANKELMDERDKRYTERDKDRQVEVDKALAAADKQTAAAFAAAKESSIETKKAQDAYNLSHNDLIRKGEELAADTISRGEFNARMISAEDKIQDLKAQTGVSVGTVAGGRLFKDDFRATLALVVSGAALLFLVWRALMGH